MIGEPGKTVFVRHGKYDHQTGELTDEGREDAIAAAREIGFPGIILSSSALRAAQTSEIIAETLGIDRVTKSDLIEKAGNDRTVVKDLTKVIRVALALDGVAYEGRGGLIVVAHEPLVTAARYAGRTKGVNIIMKADFGEVVETDLAAWENDRYASIFAVDFEADLAEAEAGLGSSDIF